MLGLKSMLNGHGVIASCAVLQRCVIGALSQHHSAFDVLQYSTGTDPKKKGRQPTTLQDGDGRHRPEGGPSSSRVESRPNAPSQSNRKFSRVESEPKVPPQTLKSITTTPLFERIWWDKGSKSRSAVSIWRPKPPPGYAVLGDCLVEGLRPPSSAIALVQDESGGSVKKPTKYHLGMDTPGTGLDHVYIWLPVAPSGYVAMGCIATNTNHMPPLDRIRCLRSDHVAQVSFSEKPLWTLSTEKMFYEDHIYTCSLWKVDNEAHTFIARESLRRPPQHMRYRLAMKNQGLLEEHNRKVHEAETMEPPRIKEREIRERVSGSQARSVSEEKVSKQQRFECSKTGNKHDARIQCNSSQRVPEKMERVVYGADKLKSSKKSSRRNESETKNHPPNGLQEKNHRAQKGGKFEATKFKYGRDEALAQNHPPSPSSGKNQRADGEIMSGRSNLMEHERQGEVVLKKSESVPQENNKNVHAGNQVQPCNQKDRKLENHDAVQRNLPQTVLQGTAQRALGEETFEATKTEYKYYDNVGKDRFPSVPEESMQKVQAGRRIEPCQKMDIPKYCDWVRNNQSRRIFEEHCQRSQGGEHGGRRVESAEKVKFDSGYDWKGMAKIGLYTAAGLAVCLTMLSPYRIGCLKLVRLVLKMLHV